MSKKLLIVGLALLTAACVPIPAEPPAASEPPQKTEQLDVCPGGYLDMLPGQSSNDPTLSSLPAYIDIVGVDSSIDGETLTAIFYLRGIPEDMAFNRKGAENMHLEYMWTVGIDIEGDTVVTSDQTDYTLATFLPPAGFWRTHQPPPVHSKMRCEPTCGNTSTIPKRMKRTC